MKRIFSTSYRGSGFRELFIALVKLYDPKTIVELGTQHGRSAIWMARALKNGHLYTYDTFRERYPKPPHSLTRASLTATQKNIIAHKLQDKITVRKKDAFLAHKDFKSVDILHVDLCNYYDNVYPVLFRWAPKVRRLIILEGGIFNKWQKKYGFKPFTKILGMKFITDRYSQIVINKDDNYAITLLIRK